MEFTVRAARDAGCAPSAANARSRTTRKFRIRTLVPAAACVATLSMGASHVEAVAQESPLTAIISSISSHEADIDRINLEIGNLREAVNQALVDLHDAQSLAEQARQGAAEARKRLEETQAEVERAQRELDQISRSSYRSSGANGTPVHADADARKDSLDRQTYLRKESKVKQRTLEELQRARTEAANEESTLRQASRLADERAAAAEEAENNARNTLDTSLRSLETQLAERDTASSELEQAQAELAEQRPEAAAAMGIGADSADTGDTGDSTAPAQSAADDAAVSEEGPGTSESDPVAADVTESSVDSTEDSTETPVETPGEAEETEDAEAGSSEAADAEEETSESVEPETAPDTASSESTKVSAGTGSSTAEASDEATPAADSGTTAAPSLADFANPDTVQAALEAFAQAVGETQAEHTTFDDPYRDTSNESDSAQIASPSSSDSANASVAETDEQEGTDVAAVLPEVDDAKQVTDKLRGTDEVSDGSREQQIEAVIARAEAQIGTPYVWGGGDANGATMGLDGKGYNGKAGYDCSGLVLYAFSGAGISLPHYTGYQYQRGTQIPVDEAERGDLLFWGNGGNQHVAIYLGDGMMLEAPQTGMNVQKTAVRRSGMAPMAVRLI